MSITSAETFRDVQKIVFANDATFYRVNYAVWLNTDWHRIAEVRAQALEGLYEEWLREYIKQFQGEILDSHKMSPEFTP